MTEPETDGDGLVDIFETAAGNTSNMLTVMAMEQMKMMEILTESGFPNWADLDADGDGIVDVIDAAGTDSNNDGSNRWLRN